jgi:beta-phosphoglucomutase family hydrolase
VRGRPAIQRPPIQEGPHPIRERPDRTLDIAGWLFDLDGVLTDTARVHAAAWKDTFDWLLTRRASVLGKPPVPFDPVSDYERYVDGKPRYDGVRDFLASRGIALPEGDRSDPPDRETVCGVGNYKNTLLLERLAKGEVTVFATSVGFVKQLKAAGRRLAVVSASENCMAVLEAAHIASLFDVVVDGLVALEHHLRGKPAPDSFLYAASQLSVEPDRAAVVEDAPAGVRAGRDGGFGLVVGVARRASAPELAAVGADVVVSDLSELSAQGV